MTERKLPLDQAHEFALAIKWREDFAAAVRALKRELWQVRRPALRFAGAVLVVSGAAFMMAGEPTALLNSENRLYELDFLCALLIIRITTYRKRIRETWRLEC